MNPRSAFLIQLCILALLSSACAGSGPASRSEETTAPPTEPAVLAETPLPTTAVTQASAGPQCAMGQPPVPLPADAQGCFFDAGVLVYKTTLNAQEVIDLYTKHFEAEGGWTRVPDSLTPKWRKGDQEVVLAIVTETTGTSIRMEFRKPLTP